MIELELPYPPTVNHYWKHTRQGRHYITDKGKAYQQAVLAACMGKPKTTGAVAVEIDVHLPDKRRRDIDNLNKALLDALSSAGVIEDDSLIHKLTLEKKGLVKGGKVVVRSWVMKNSVQLHINIDDVLRVWVRRWAAEKGCKGYPSLQGFMRESPVVITRFSICELDDETYARIDTAVMMLHDLNLDAYQVLMAVFLQQQGKREICTAMRITPRTYDNRLKTARDFMQGAVFGSGLVRVRF